jgi:hypothetical protein
MVVVFVWCFNVEFQFNFIKENIQLVKELVRVRHKISRKPLRGKIQLVTIFTSLLFILISCSNSGGSPLCVAASLPVAQEQVVKIRSDGTTIVSNKPFFPFGFYHVSWETSGAERLTHLREIAASGFNAIHASATNLEDYGAFLDEAERLGVYVMTEQNVGLEKLINAYKDKPAVLGWSLADDVEEGTVMPQQVLELHRLAKTIDPNHITYISGYSDEIGRFAKCSDVMAMQAYPVRVGQVDLASTFAKVSLARDIVAKFNGSVYANLQAFDWWSSTKLPEFRGSRPPTVDEVRNMTYQALLAGAKGIFYYTYFDDNWSLSEHPELWAGTKSLVPEIKTLSLILTQGKVTVFDSGVKDILAGAWIDQQRAIAVVINTSYDHTAEVAINLPMPVHSMQPMFEGRPSGMVINQNILSGLVKPITVHVYNLEG